MNEVAERKLVFEDSRGNRFIVRSAIGVPVKISSHDYTCKVILDGFLENLEEIHGVDSIQSLSLALKFQKQLLENFRSSGGKIFIEDGSSEVDLGSYY